MGKGLWLSRGFRRRDIVVWLTLFNHLIITVGFPLPAPHLTKTTNDISYPCQSRPCGCLTSEQCWEGDCCCFTIEEKLAWAEANGIVPPEHVRPLVTSRASRSTSPKTPSCCSEVAPELSMMAQLTSDNGTCCEEQEPATNCCDDPPVCAIEPVTDCPSSTPISPSNCCGENEQAPTPDHESEVRWVVGIFAQKCRGAGPEGILPVDPIVVPVLTPFHLPAPEPTGHVAPRSERPPSPTHSPPTPPPRSS